MPIYEYECEECRLRFEVTMPFSVDRGTVCPQYTRYARRLFSPVPIIFKGSGFYITDSKNHSLSDDKKTH